LPGYGSETRTPPDPDPDPLQPVRIWYDDAREAMANLKDIFDRAPPGIKA